jgi:hypothetical protein
MRPFITEHASYAESLAGHLTCWRNGLRLDSPAGAGGGALVISVDEHLGADYAMLWRFLYVHHYCHAPRLWDDEDADGMERLGLRVADLPFLGELAGADFGRGWWDPGWRVVRGSAAAPAEAVPVEKAGIRLSAPRRDVRLPDANGRPCPAEPCLGEPVLVRFPSGTAGRMTGFYHVTGAAGPATTEALMRIYLNVRPAHAPTTVQRVVAGLNEAGIRFTLKIVNSRRHLRRRDNTVVYLAERDLDAALVTVQEVTLQGGAARGSTAQGAAAPAQPALNPETPLFTRKIAAGISVAAEGLAPGRLAADKRNWSFGESRCKFLARGLLLHAVGGCPGGCDMAEVLRDAFRRAGLDPERPYERPAEMAVAG